MKGKFAVVRLSALGDVVLISPALEYLSKRGEVIFLTYDPFAPVYEGDTRINRILTLPRKPSIRDIVTVADTLADMGVEVVFDLQVKPVTLLISYLLRKRGIPTVRTEKRSLRRRLHALFGLPLAYRYVPDIHLHVVSSYFGEPAPRIKPRLQPAPSPFDLPKPYVILSPEASASLKEWDTNRFVDLAHRVAHAGYEVVWVGTRRHPEVPVGTDLREKTDIKGLIGVISEASALVGNDSAAVHIAYALGVPAVVIMGPTTVSFGFIPKSPSVKVVERSIKCRPCSTNGSGRCVVGGRPCMDIQPDEVWNSLQLLLR